MSWVVRSSSTRAKPSSALLALHDKPESKTTVDAIESVETKAEGDSLKSNADVVRASEDWMNRQSMCTMEAM
jgi:hypothetical protein